LTAVSFERAWNNRMPRLPSGKRKSAIQFLSVQPQVDHHNGMTVKRTKPVSLEELWDYEDKNPVVFASPRALAEARLIARLERTKRNQRHAQANGDSRRHKAVAA